MKNNLYQLLAALFIVFSISIQSTAQDSLSNELRYDVNLIYQPGSISFEKLKTVQTLADLHRFYRPSWVREYISVKLLASQDGKIIKAISKNDTLSQEQINIIRSADFGSEITVIVHYIPENTLKQNDSKTFDFKFTVNPEYEASFVGGKQALKKYLKEQAIDKIPESSFDQSNLAALNFTVNEEGEITNVHFFESSKDEKTDTVLLAAIQTMPCWKPAKYSNGQKVKQEFSLMVGNMESCIINLINLRNLD